VELYIFHVITEYEKNSVSFYFMFSCPSIRGEKTILRGSIWKMATRGHEVPLFSSVWPPVIYSPLCQWATVAIIMASHRPRGNGGLIGGFGYLGDIFLLFSI
jgi:hypothetical protein